MPRTSTNSDIVIVGAGIIGLATALKAQAKFPDSRVTVVEAEAGVGRHQSGHNSGVIHSGIYYKPGSEKALNCRAGKAAMEQFCDEHNIAWDRCGKVVVATNEAELERLGHIADRATANGVQYERINTDQLRELEPNAAGVAALHVPETGIVNFRKVCDVMAQQVRRGGGKIEFTFGVRQIETQASSISVTSGNGATINCAKMINCAGLYCDHVCRLAGDDPGIKIVPFRGEYYELTPASESLCRNLIYPVPDPALPFLGVHFTRMIDGGVECGPNAVLALARQGYRWTNVNPKELASTLMYSGFRKLAARFWRTGLGEVRRSLSKSAFVAALQHLIPSIQASDLKPGRAGVRAQAVAPNGDLVDDFLIKHSSNAIHVLNAPSPAATASLAIADRIVSELERGDAAAER